MTEISEQIEETTNERIGFGRRLGAYMLDALVVTVVGVILGLLVGEQLAPILFGEQLAQFEELYSHIGSKFVDILYTTMEIASGTSIVGLSLIVMEGAFGQSYGKMILKIKNTNVDGSPASAQKLWIRALLKYGASLISLIAGIASLTFLGWIANLWGIVIFIGFFMVFADNKQTIHDMIAKTVVSRK